MKFTFNKNYEDLSQVEQYYNDFIKLYNEFKKEYSTPYNSLFKNKIKGIIGDDKQEDIAIYLLQELKVKKNINKTKAKLLKKGYKEITKDKQGIKKYKNVVIIGSNWSEDDVREFKNGKIVFDEHNYIRAVMPSRNRTRGYNPIGNIVLAI